MSIWFWHSPTCYGAFPPFTGWAEEYLYIRSIQKVLLSMIIPPLLWAGLPFHCLLFALPKRFRDIVVRNVVQKSKNRRTLQFLARPSLAWLFYISIFLLWHEPTLVSLLIQRYWLNHIFAWVLLAASILFWSQILHTAPRINRPQPGWIVFIMLIAVEIPNMIAGVTVAFANEAIYSHYASQHLTQEGNGLSQSLTAVEDQQLGGCITWIAGSIVYVSTIIMVLSRLFKQEDGLPPLLSFTDGADERTIAPGLEYRVSQNRWGQIEAGEKSK